MLVFVLLKQILIMAILAAVGVVLDRKSILTEEGSRDIGTLLLKVVIPCVIVRSYIVERTPERMQALLFSVIFAVAGLLVAMMISALAFGRRRSIDTFAAAFCNAGFIGIPLVQAVVGTQGVFYIAATIAFLNFFQWTFGVYIMTGHRESISAAAILKNPVVIAITAGIILFVFQVPVPGMLQTVLGYMADMNTPLAMLLLGTYLAKMKPKDIFANKHAYECAIFRLLVIPAVTVILYRLIPCPEKSVALASFIAAATPTGSNICIFAKQFDCDYNYSVIPVCLSTVLSLITVPLMFVLAQSVLG